MEIINKVYSILKKNNLLNMDIYNTWSCLDGHDKIIVLKENDRFIEIGVVKSEDYIDIIGVTPEEFKELLKKIIE